MCIDIDIDEMRERVNRFYKFNYEMLSESAKKKYPFQISLLSENSDKIYNSVDEIPDDLIVEEFLFLQTACIDY